MLASCDDQGLQSHLGQASRKWFSKWPASEQCQQAHQPEPWTAYGCTRAFPLPLLALLFEPCDNGVVVLLTICMTAVPRPYCGCFVDDLWVR